MIIIKQLSQLSFVRVLPFLFQFSLQDYICTTTIIIAHHQSASVPHVYLILFVLNKTQIPTHYLLIILMKEKKTFFLLVFAIFFYYNTFALRSVIYMRWCHSHKQKDEKKLLISLDVVDFGVLLDHPWSFQFSWNFSKFYLNSFFVVFFFGLNDP